jgi:hypothetical protein
MKTQQPREKGEGAGALVDRSFLMGNDELGLCLAWTSSHSGSLMQQGSKCVASLYDDSEPTNSCANALGRRWLTMQRGRHY